MTGKKTNFELVNLVLNQLRVDVEKVHGEKTIDVVKSKFNQLSSGYDRLTDPSFPPVDYSLPETRFAYVYTYVASHADWMYQILNLTADALGKPLAAKDRAVVSCLGGGPGSEFVGLVQFLSELENVALKNLTAYLCDREQAWADCWTEIGPEVDVKFNLSANFQALDVTDQHSWSKQKKFLSADLFMSVFFASEITRFGAAADLFWSEIAASAKSGAMMLIIDNNSQPFLDYINEKIIAITWDVLEAGARDFRPSYYEDKTALGEHLKDFKRYPRMKGNSFFWLLRKK
ncbi:hypothetical protein [Dyella sp.]|uniref:hypothetical protein n=1 Tax=Dyella sp. TaxID=1869338 RepID=UPI003F80180A